jgi:hypothetical protein
MRPKKWMAGHTRPIETSIMPVALKREIPLKSDLCARDCDRVRERQRAKETARHLREAVAKLRIETIFFDARVDVVVVASVEAVDERRIAEQASTHCDASGK